MLKENNVYYNNPLVYIFLTLLLSSFTYEVYFYSRLAAILIAVSLFILVSFNTEKYLKFFLVITFIIGINNNVYYYDFTADKTEEIRILSLNYDFGVAEMQGRKVNISIYGAEEFIGSKIYAKGEYKKNNNIDKGIVGEFKVLEYEKSKDDFIVYLYKVKKLLYNKIQNKLGARKAGIISSVAYGDTENLDSYDRENMKHYGVSHVMSVSGLHITLIYSISILLGSNILAMIIAFFYMMFSGARESVIRSYIMIIVSNLAVKFKREYNMLSALSLSGIILLIIKPYCLFNIGFILSFINIFGIYLLNKKLNRVLYKVPEKIRSVIAINLATQIFTIPICMLYFNELCANSIIGNILIVPLINLLIVLGNLLILFIKIPFIFNYILFICKYIIIAIDKAIYFLEDITLDIFYMHYGFAYLYLSMLITYYFYKKGHKRFIYYPIVVLVYVLIIIYSPIANIKYYRDGGFLVSYRGKRVLIEYGEYNEETEYKLKKSTLTEKNIDKEDFYKFYIKEGCYIIKNGHNYVLKTEKNQCLLKTNYDKINYKYDIIDFTKGDIEDVWILNDNIISRR